MPELVTVDRNVLSRRIGGSRWIAFRRGKGRAAGLSQARTSAALFRSTSFFLAPASSFSFSPTRSSVLLALHSPSSTFFPSRPPSSLFLFSISTFDLSLSSVGVSLSLLLLSSSQYNS